MTQEKEIKLPKQWKDWCRAAGLGLNKPIRPYQRNTKSWFYLVGRGHQWRISMYGEFQCGDSLSDFDRWARSYNVYVDFDIFKSRDQFVKIVKQMVKFHEATYPDGKAMDGHDWDVLMEVV